MEHKSLRDKLTQRSGFVVWAELTGGPAGNGAAGLCFMGFALRD